MRDSPPPSAAGFTHSGDEAPLVNEKNNLDKTKTEYNIEVNMIVRCKDNEGKRKAKRNADITRKRRQFNLRQMAHVAIHHFSPLSLPPGRGLQAQENLPRSHYPIGWRLLPLRFSKQLTHRFWLLAFSPIFIWAIPNIYPGFF
jgi:hypothetical protein